LNLSEDIAPQRPPGRYTARAAYTVDEFCDAHRISRSKLYELWAAGIGPRFIQIGTKKIISIEAAAAWRLANESEHEGTA
jgi:hypothetical protein